MRDAPYLPKSLECIKAAKLLMENGCPNSVANRAYYAAFHAARAAIVAAGAAKEKKWSHEAVQAAFSRLINERKLYPSALRETLSNLIATRHLADYHWEMVSLRMAQKMLRMAQELVSAVEEKIGDD